MGIPERLDAEQRALLRRLLVEMEALPQPHIGSTADHVAAGERISAIADAGVRDLWEWRGIPVTPPPPQLPLTAGQLSALDPEAARDQRALREVIGWVEDALGGAYVHVPACAVGTDLALLALLAHYYASRVFWSELLAACGSSP